MPLTVFEVLGPDQRVAGELACRVPLAHGQQVGLVGRPGGCLVDERQAAPVLDRLGPGCRIVVVHRRRRWAVPGNVKIEVVDATWVPHSPPCSRGAAPTYYPAQPLIWRVGACETRNLRGRGAGIHRLSKSSDWLSIEAPPAAQLRLLIVEAAPFEKTRARAPQQRWPTRRTPPSSAPRSAGAWTPSTPSSSGGRPRRPLGMLGRRRSCCGTSWARTAGG